MGNWKESDVVIVCTGLGGSICVALRLAWNNSILRGHP